MNAQSIDEDNLKAGTENENYTFDDFYRDMMDSGTTFNVKHDYRYDKSDNSEHLFINSTNLVINGNGFTIDGANSLYGFKFSNDEMEENQLINVSINNLTFRNFGETPVEFQAANVNLNNVKFVNCSCPLGGIVLCKESIVNLNNAYFYTRNCTNFVLIETPCNITINNTEFDGTNCSESAIWQYRGHLIIENCRFGNFSTKNAAAINYKGDYLSIKNSKFRNSLVVSSGGAIIAKFFPASNDDSTGYVPSDDFLIENCEFDNLSAGNDGGVIYIDLDSGADHVHKSLNVINSNFTHCTSRYGGAIAIQGGFLNIECSNFINNSAGFEGGALFTSWSNVNISDSSFINNTAVNTAGAIYFDKGKLTVKDSYLIGNKAMKPSSIAANCIYAHDVDAYFSNSTFDNGGVSVYVDFATDSKLENITKNEDIFLMDNKNYIVSVESKGIKLNLTKNEIIVNQLPSKFDLNEWGWVSPVKLQGDNDDCWAFATVASLESSLLKATGQYYNLSQNYVQKLQLKYYPYGDLRISLTGFAYSGLGYALSWIGALPTDASYDDRGMIADTDFNVSRIHLQDAMIILPGGNDTIDMIKKAIMKYGSVSVQLILADINDELITTGDDIAFMDHSIHFITLIGWDDNQTTDYGKGVWLTKDSLFGFYHQSYDDESLLAVDYYSIVPQNPAICYIFENDIDYHVNYQTDLTGLTGFDSNYTYYSNEFISKYDELIGAVGTYFNESGIDYSFDVYVNGKIVHSQKGVSEFAGFRTIVLSKYIPVCAGDKFKVVFKNNALPYQAYSRLHYVPGMSMVSADGKTWSDMEPLNKTVCLKVYTVADDCKVIQNKDITVTYGDGSYFKVKVVTGDGRPVGAGEAVEFTINGKTTTVKTDSSGIAKIKITNKVGSYTVTTALNKNKYKNKVIIKAKPNKIVLKASKVTIKKKSAKKLVLKATLKINGKAVKGKLIKFTLNGKTYKAKTNKKGVAQKTLKKSVIKKLNKGKTYTVKVIYLKKSIKTKVIVK
ncbi:lectin like domain-containing protein [Methanobrevibacter sp.]|uniref:lectin like domain-containing protein n=1 Tax=Methanobrevibacter sp. TaxID=66852 RepID=UPI00386A7892